VCVCVCVGVGECVSHTSMVLKQLHRWSWFLAYMLPSTLCFKEIGVFAKIRVLAFVTLSQTLDLEKFTPTKYSRHLLFTTPDNDGGCDQVPSTVDRLTEC